MGMWKLVLQQRRSNTGEHIGFLVCIESLLLTGDFELVIMIEVATEEMHGSD